MPVRQNDNDEKMTETETALFTEIGKNIRNLRERNQLTQEKLSERIGVTQKTISKWENGERKIKLENMVKVVEALGVSFDELMLGVVNKVKQEAKTCTLQEACKFLFIDLPKATKTTWTLSDPKRMMSDSALFDVGERPSINLSIPLLPFYIYAIGTADNSSRKFRLNPYGVQMARFANDAGNLNACSYEPSEVEYDKLLSTVSTTPLSQFCTEFHYRDLRENIEGSVQELQGESPKLFL